ncbi:MAG TPA: hypothetical protein VLG48_13060 [Candidatus Methylomirabilis sp.]|nr:hypothetical protein [Candidatus Methylomirabilis sp.]
MDPLSRIESQRRFIQERAQELLARVDQMDEEELRWTVRVFADCLSPDERATHLGTYSEHWNVGQLRHFLPTFIQQYTDIALRDLRAKEGSQGTRLADLTEEELQSMSLAEKCYLLAADPGGLRPDQLRRELARLFMCKSFDLFHDTGLSEAAVEFPAYHRIREGLEAQPQTTVEALKDMILLRSGHLNEGTPDEVEVALAEIREAIGRTLGILIPVDQLFTGQMVLLPLDRPDEAPPAIPPTSEDALGGMPAEDLATTFLVLTDLMSLREWEEYVLPLQRQYRAITEMPPEALRDLLGRLSGRMGDRRITDFAERYRSGRMVAERKVDREIWNLLPLAERQAILERDNRTMDAAQAARHLVKIFFSFQYDMLFDAGFQVDLLRSPRYQRLVNSMISGEEAEQPLNELIQTVTRMMLELEGLPPEARPARLQRIRTLIATALGLPDDLTYPAAKEGRA